MNDQRSSVRPSRPAVKVCRPSTSRSRSAFTLVEVSLALGIIAFCGVALIGMVPVGLQTEAGAADQIQATRLLNEVREDLVSIAKPYANTGNPDDAKQGQVLASTNRFQISLKLPTDTNSSPVQGNFMVDDGFRLTNGASTARYVVHYDYTHFNANSAGAPPTFLPYQIRVLVAWPASAQFSGSGSSLTVTGARGYRETALTLNRL